MLDIYLLSFIVGSAPLQWQPAVNKLIRSNGECLRWLEHWLVGSQTVYNQVY